MKNLIFLVVSIVFISGCAPEIGSKEWCEDLKEKPKGDWTLNEGKDFAKHCLFKDDE